MEAGKAIYNILSNASGVTSITTNIYGNEAKQTQDFPIIVYTVISDTAVGSKSNLKALQSRVQVSCFADSYDSVNALAIAVRNALSDKTQGSYGGVTVQTIKFDSSNDLTDNAGFDGVNHIALDFFIFYTL
jgi:predicted component of type VI protein secretion system